MPTFDIKSSVISETQIIPFKIDTWGWYVIIIAAKVKSEKHVYIVTPLRSGAHTLTLTPQYQASITRAEYQSISVHNNQISLDFNLQAPNLNGHPWIAVGLLDATLTEVTIKAKVWWHWFDGDDIKVIINNQLIKAARKIRKDWMFSASVFDTKGREQSEKIIAQALSSNTQNDIQYVELIADQSPLLQNLTFNLTPHFVKKYTKSLNEENYNQYDQEIETSVKSWNGHFKSQLYSPNEELDPNLIKAMMYVESRMGYYQPPAGYYPAFPDIMQIGDPRNPAIHTLNNDGWTDPNTGEIAQEYEWTEFGPKILKHTVVIQTPQDSIHWAIFWLFHKAEKIGENLQRTWRSWPEAIQKYNGGGDASYKNKVYDIYQNNGPL